MKNRIITRIQTMSVRKLDSTTAALDPDVASALERAMQRGATAEALVAAIDTVAADDQGEGDTDPAKMAAGIRVRTARGRTAIVRFSTNEIELHRKRPTDVRKLAQIKADMAEKNPASATRGVTFVG